MYKTVIRLLEVPVGKYCYHYENDAPIMCSWLVINSGFPTCLNDFNADREDDSVNILKDPECLELEDYKEKE